MFDVGFSELCLIGLVSLLVIGPERLPKVARIAGYWLGKTRNMMTSVKEEIKLELQAEEMRQIFKEQSALHDNIQKMLDETSNTIKSTLDPVPIAAKTQNDDREQLPTDTTERHEPK